MLCRMSLGYWPNCLSIRLPIGVELVEMKMRDLSGYSPVGDGENHRVRDPWVNTGGLLECMKEKV